MKVLLDHSLPFLLAHGGFQVQIEQTKLALESAEVEVEFARWWDDTQRADLIHYFGRPAEQYVELAHQKRIRVVLADLLSELGSRSRGLRILQKTLKTAAETLLPPSFVARLAWKSFRMADACIAGTSWEARLMTEMFRAPPQRVHIVPNGTEAIFFQSQPAVRGQWLVCTAAIAERKRVVELAEAAVRAQTPLWVVGKPYGEHDPYASRFFEIAKQNRSLVRYEGAVSDRGKLAQIYREARGFVLLSSRESLSLSAAEAAACACPLLLSDLPWARTVYGDGAWYCPVPANTGKTAEILKAFHAAAPALKAPARPPSWPEVGLQFSSIYERVLKQPW